MKITTRHLRQIIREELETQTEDRELIRTVLSKLPKRSTYMKFALVDGQGQYWFDLTWPYGDYAARNGVPNYDDGQSHRGFFEPVIRKLRSVLPQGVAVVSRDKSIVVVKG